MCYVLPLLLSQSLLITSVLFVYRKSRNIRAIDRAACCCSQATTVSKQIFNAAKRLVAKIVHKAKSLFFGNEIAMSKSSRQLFNVCYKLIGRKRSSPLSPTYPLHDLPNVFNDYFLQKVQSIRADLDQQSLSLTSCRLTDQQADSILIN